MVTSPSVDECLSPGKATCRGLGMGQTHEAFLQTENLSSTIGSAYCIDDKPGCFGMAAGTILTRGRKN